MGVVEGICESIGLLGVGGVLVPVSQVTKWNWESFALSCASLA